MMWRRRNIYVTVSQLNQIIQSLKEEIASMATQADVDAVVTALKDDEAGLVAVQTTVASVDTKLTTAQATLQAELDALAAKNPTLDLTALQAIPGELSAVNASLSSATAALGTHVDAVGALVPTPPPTPGP